MTECLCQAKKCLIDGSHECENVGELNKLECEKEYCCACWQKYFCPDFTPNKWCRTCQERIYGFIKDCDFEFQIIFADPTELSSYDSATLGTPDEGDSHFNHVSKNHKKS